MAQRACNVSAGDYECHVKLLYMYLSLFVWLQWLHEESRFVWWRPEHLQSRTCRINPITFPNSLKTMRTPPHTHTTTCTYLCFSIESLSHNTHANAKKTEIIYYGWDVKRQQTWTDIVPLFRHFSFLLERRCNVTFSNSSTSSGLSSKRVGGRRKAIIVIRNDGDQW